MFSLILLLIFYNYISSTNCLNLSNKFIRKIHDYTMRLNFPSYENKSKVCRVCKTIYYITDSTKTKNCYYHTGRWMGAEKSKHYGTRSGGQNIGLSLFWDCCEAESPDDKGCCTGYHKSFDDE